MGSIISGSGSGACPMFDDASAIVVELSDPAMLLAEATDAALLAGANMAAAGREFIQFGRVEPVGPARWRLTRLLRGRLGSEHETAMAGDGFALVDDPALMPLPARVGLTPAGGQSRVEIAGVGDAVPLALAIAPQSRTVAPLSPAVPAVRRLADGGVTLNWARRTLAGVGWDDGSDIPPSPSGEYNRLTLVAGSRSESFDLAADDFALNGQQLAQWGNPGTPVTVALERVGSRARSAARTITLII